MSPIDDLPSPPVDDEQAFAALLAAALDPLPMDDAVRLALLARLLLLIAGQEEGLPKEP